MRCKSTTVSGSRCRNEGAHGGAHCAAHRRKRGAGGKARRPARRTHAARAYMWTADDMKIDQPPTTWSWDWFADWLPWRNQAYVPDASLPTIRQTSLNNQKARYDTLAGQARNHFLSGTRSRAELAIVDAHLAEAKEDIEDGYPTLASTKLDAAAALL